MADHAGTLLNKLYIFICLYGEPSTTILGREVGYKLMVSEKVCSQHVMVEMKK